MLPNARKVFVGAGPFLWPIACALLIATSAAALSDGSRAGEPTADEAADGTATERSIDEPVSLDETDSLPSNGNAVSPPVAPGSSKKKKPAKSKPAPWRVLHLPTQAHGQAFLALSDKSPVQPVTKLDLTGPDVGHPFLFGKFAINGRFAIVDGVLQRSEGLNAAIELGEAEAFELEGLIDASGLGGWFLLCGWDDGSGYLIYNVNMKTSGCLWNVFELVRATAVQNTHHEFNRLEWKGTLPFALRIADKQFQLRVGDAQLALDEPLANYQAGKVILGTYDTKYGPRNLKIQSLRMRSLSAAKK